MAKEITARELGKLLFQELERDQWGDIDPWWFKPDYDVGESKDLYEVLERVVKRLNKRRSKKAD